MNRNIFHYTVILIVLFIISTNSMAKAVKPIPIPDISITEAVAIAARTFQSEFPDNRHFTESPNFRIKDFIVIKAYYTNHFDGKQSIQCYSILNDYYSELKGISLKSGSVISFQTAGDILLLVVTLRVTARRCSLDGRRTGTVYF